MQAEKSEAQGLANEDVLRKELEVHSPFEEEDPAELERFLEVADGVCREEGVAQHKLDARTYREAEETGEQSDDRGT